MHLSRGSDEYARIDGSKRENADAERAKEKQQEGAPFQHIVNICHGEDGRRTLQGVCSEMSITVQICGLRRDQDFGGRVRILGVAGQDVGGVG
jgi:hypothetical protein